MSAGANPYDWIFQQPPAGPPAPAVPADPYAPFFAPPPTGTLSGIQQAIFVAEGGRKAKVPYGYAVSKPQLFGANAWAAKARYDQAVRLELQTEQRTYEDLKRTGKIPADWDFIRYLARQGYNANPKEWHDWERNVRANLPVAAAAPPAAPAPPPFPRTRAELERRETLRGVQRTATEAQAEAQAATRAEQQELVRQGRGYFRYGVFIPRKPQGPRAEAFQRGLAAGVPGFGARVVRQQAEERRAREQAELGPEAAALYGGERRFAAPFRPPLGERAAEFVGMGVSFGLLSGPALGATVGRVMVRAMGGKAAIAAAPALTRFVVNLERIAGEGAVFGALDAIIGEWDTLRRMPPAEAADHVARAAAVTGRDFALFVGGITGLISVLRAGRMSIRQLRGIRTDLDALARTMRETGELPAAEVEAIGAREARTRRVERSAAQAAAQADARIQQARQRAPTAPSERGVPLAQPAAQAPLLPAIEPVTQPGLRERVPTAVERRRAISEQEAAQMEALQARLGRYYQRAGEAIVLQPRAVRVAPEIVRPGAALAAPGRIIVPGVAPVRPEVGPAIVPARPAEIPAPEQVPLPTAAAPAAPPPAPRIEPGAPVPEWTEVGRAKTATEAARILADQQAKFPQLEVRARPVNARRPKGAQLLEARSRPAAGPVAPAAEAAPAVPPTLPTPPVPAVQPAKLIAPEKGLVELSPEQKERLRQQLVLTEELGAALDDQAKMPADQSQLVTAMVDQAAFQYAREPTTLRGVVKIADDAWKAYSKNPQAKTRPLTQDWFRRFVRAMYSDIASDPMGEHAARTVFDPGTPLSRRLDTATRNADVLERRLAPPKRPPVGGAAEQRADAYAALKERGAELLDTRQLQVVSRGVLAGAVRQADSVMRKMGADGIDMVVRKEAVRRTAALEHGEELARIMQANLGRGQWEKVRMAREGTVVQLTPKEQHALNVANDILGESPQAGPVGRARQLGLKSEDGGEVGFMANYWPIVLDAKIAERRPSEAIKKIMDSTGADEERARELLNRWMSRNRRGRMFGNLERRREDWAPYEIRLPALEELVYYSRGKARRLAEARFYGPDNEIMNASLGRIRETSPDDAAFVEGWLDAVQGRVPREVFLDAIIGEITDVQVASKMVLSVFSNASQTVNNMFEVGLVRTFRGIQAAFHPVTKAELRNFGRRAGASIEGMTRELGIELGLRPSGREARVLPMAERVLKKTKFLTVEDGNRLISAYIGREWAQDLAGALTRAEGGRPSWLRNRRIADIRHHLEKVGLDPEEIIRQGGRLTDEQQRIAGWTLADRTQFPIGDPGSLPLWWNSPWGKVATQLKRFAYRQGVFVWDAVVNEAKRGNFKPLILFLTVYPAVGEVVADVRLLARRFPKAMVDPLGVLAEGRPQTFWRRLFQNYAFVGGIGLASDLIRAIEARAPWEAIISFLFGPSASDASTALYNALRVVRAVPEGPTEAATGAGARQLTRQAVGLFVTPRLTAAFGIPGAIAGEAVESAFRAPPRRTRSRPRRRTRR